jgi:DNA (cytosine-5)-methyltransferase 1
MSGGLGAVYANRKGDTDMTLKMLDCFCGMGGVSDGFALEGFDVTGIDIVDAPKKLGYKHRFIQADMATLKGEDFRGYDVVWGSPPCRDFTKIGRIYGHNWKQPPSPMRGMQFVDCFLQFVVDAKPRIWILENVSELAHYLPSKPNFVSYISISSKNGQGKLHAFWGNFPKFLLPKVTNKRVGYHVQNPYGRKDWMRQKTKGKNASWENAKIPLSCSRAFAVACRQALEQPKETQT